MKTRIYVVTDTTVKPAKNRLVRAGSAAAARNYVARDQYLVAVAGQDDLVANLHAGLKVEDAAVEQEGESD